LAFGQWADFYLESYSKPPVRAEKTHEANERCIKHLKPAFGTSRLVDITADSIDLYLRECLRQPVRIRAKLAYKLLGAINATTIHQEFRVLRRMLKVAVRKKLLATNPCSGAEFPVAVKGLFRPHYVTWSEQQRIESHGPQYLRSVIQIITETGLRIYKELTSMRKNQVDLQNAVVWIPDSKTANGIAEVPLTSLAIEVFKSQMAISGEELFLFPSDRNPNGHQAGSRLFGEKLFDEQMFPTFGFMTSAPRTPQG
jgi:integrase